MRNSQIIDNFANDELAQLAGSIKIPIRATGGVGSMLHFVDVFTKGKADAARVVSEFHYQEIAILKLKHYQSRQGIALR
ncbi:MAG: HisA/HisF-related TIM barrel protein [Mangrovibacterium sp.]